MQLSKRRSEWILKKIPSRKRDLFKNLRNFEAIIHDNQIKGASLSRRVLTAMRTYELTHSVNSFEVDEFLESRDSESCNCRENPVIDEGHENNLKVT